MKILSYESRNIKNLFASHTNLVVYLKRVHVKPFLKRESTVSLANQFWQLTNYTKGTNDEVYSL
jgi:hypothetical protein